MPELVEDGVTGVLAHGIGSRRSRASSALRASTAPRAARAAVRRFSADRMVDDYLDVYENVLRDR